MKRNVVLIGFAVLLLVVASGSVLFWKKYDEWYVYPPMRAFVTEDLKDASSVQFRSERLVLSDRRNWLCGELNAKNSYGAYTGFKRFVVADVDDAWLEDEGRIKPKQWTTKDATYHIAFLAKKTARQEQINEYYYTHKSFPSFGELTDEEIKQELFEEKWKSVCS